jgi:hypothetical protein
MPGATVEHVTQQPAFAPIGHLKPKPFAVAVATWPVLALDSVLGESAHCVPTNPGVTGPGGWLPTPLPTKRPWN